MRNKSNPYVQEARAKMEQAIMQTYRPEFQRRREAMNANADRAEQKRLRELDPLEQQHEYEHSDSAI